MDMDTPNAPPSTARHTRAIVPVTLAVLTAVVLAGGQALFGHAHAQNNRVALADAPRTVAVVAARATEYRPSRRYIGTLEAWVSARIGPEIVAGYVSEVTVRPGAVVRAGDVLARLDCREANATSRALSLQARATRARQSALAHQATRMSDLLGAGFVAENDVEMRRAESESEQARLLAAQAQMAGAALTERDCVLRAPFDGEVAERLLDPGAFVRPGGSIVTMVDRRTVRITADVPETDFDVVAPGTPVQIKLLANGHQITGTVTRRAPSADAATRTVHVEIDLANADRALPVHTTADLHVDAGAPTPALEIPVTAASVRGARASVFVVEGGVARQRVLPLLGERGGELYVAREILEGSRVVTEGRALLSDGDRVAARDEAAR